MRELKIGTQHPVTRIRFSCLSSWIPIYVIRSHDKTADFKSCNYVLVNRWAISAENQKRH